MSAVTITLNGITKYDCDTYYPYFAIRNDSEGVVYASTTNPECTPDTEGVVSIASGDGYMAANTDNDNTCLYLSGTGKVTVIAQYDKIDTSIIMTNVYYLDSGMSLPPANDFKIGDTKYCRFCYNIVTKL